MHERMDTQQRRTWRPAREGFPEGDAVVRWMVGMLKADVGVETTELACRYEGTSADLFCVIDRRCKELLH